MTHRAERASRPRALGAIAIGCAASLVIGGSAFALGPALAADGAPAAAPVATPLPTITVTPQAPAASSVTVRPAPAAGTAATKGKAKKTKPLTLAELRTAVKRIDAELELRTRAVEDSRKKLAASKKRLAVVTAEATTARAEADRAHIDLGKYAAAAYRGQQISPVVTVLMGPPAGATDTLRNLENLQQTGEIKTDITTYAAATASRAEALEAEGAALTAANAVTAYNLEIQLDDVELVAKTTQGQLVAEMRRVAEAKALAAAKSCQAKAKVAAEFPNGLIPASALCSIGIGNYMLRGDAAVAFKKLAAAYKKDFDEQICVTSAYRDRALQARLFADDPIMVAMPGKSHHGLGLATDLCGGIQNFSSPQYKWMKENAEKHGFFHPDWAEPDGVTPEPWHWEFKVDAYPAND